MSLGVSNKTFNAKEVVLKKEAKLILSEKLISQINDTHRAVKEDTEWSSILLYKIKEGSIEKEGPLVLEAKEMILMDIGTATYTEYDMNNPKDEYAYDKLTDALVDGFKIGHLHTHHSMECYFSSVDKDELFENSPNHNFYLSLIVNYKDTSKWCAKLAIMVEKNVEGSFKSKVNWLHNKDKIFSIEEESINEKEQIMYTIDLTIESDILNEVSNEIKDRIKQIEDQKKEAEKSKRSLRYSNWWGGLDEDEDQKTTRKNYSDINYRSFVVAKKMPSVKELLDVHLSNKKLKGKNKKTKIFFNQLVWDKSFLEEVLNETLENTLNKDLVKISTKDSLYLNLREINSISLIGDLNEAEKSLNLHFADSLVKKLESILNLIIYKNQLNSLTDFEKAVQIGLILSLFVLDEKLSIARSISSEEDNNLGDVLIENLIYEINWIGDIEFTSEYINFISDGVYNLMTLESKFNSIIRKYGSKEVIESSLRLFDDV